MTFKLQLSHFEKGNKIAQDIKISKLFFEKYIHVVPQKANIVTTLDKKKGF